MRDQVIEFVALKELRTPYDFTEAFQVRKDKKHVWLQKVCAWIMRKLRAFQIAEHVTIERHVINGDKFMEAVFKQRSELMRHFNRSAKSILIGSEDYASLMREGVAENQAFAFQSHYRDGRQLIGLNVHVLPYMRGIVVVPFEVPSDR